MCCVVNAVVAELLELTQTIAPSSSHMMLTLGRPVFVPVQLVSQILLVTMPIAFVVACSMGLCLAVPGRPTSRDPTTSARLG